MISLRKALLLQLAETDPHHAATEPQRTATEPQRAGNDPQRAATDPRLAGAVRPACTRLPPRLPA